MHALFYICVFIYVYACIWACLSCLLPCVICLYFIMLWFVFIAVVDGLINDELNLKKWIDGYYKRWIELSDEHANNAEQDWTMAGLGK